MRFAAKVIAAVTLLLAGLAPTATADSIAATSSVTLSTDPGFEGMYKYKIDVVWFLENHDLGHLDMFLDLATFDDTCSGSVVRFASPAGHSTGENGLGGNCTVNYRGEFLCKTDPSIPFSALGATVKFEPLEVGCSTTTQGSGHFEFYSFVGPDLASLHGNAVCIKHGQEIDFGGLFGPLPLGGSGGQPLDAPVVINEFLVKPKPGESEFIELFNKTGSVGSPGTELEFAL